jgi:protein involved in polysaccharide export with SLBB domain
MRALFNTPRVCLCLAGLAAATLAWSGCAGGDPSSSPSSSAAKQTKADDTENHLFDPLMRGDRIEIDLTGTPASVPPSVQNIQQDGTISLANIGSLQAAGLTPGQLEVEITTNYVPAVYIHLNVNVTPLLRYFYVGGQIKNSGSGGRQTYTSAITLTRAIQAAGDFNEYADQRHVRLTRMRTGKSIVVDCKRILRHGAPDPAVAPGDQIWVPMRRF